MVSLHHINVEVLSTTIVLPIRHPVLVPMVTP